MSVLVTVLSVLMLNSVTSGRKPLIDEVQPDEEPRFRLSDIFGTMREGILIVSQDMLVTASNAAAAKAFMRNGGSLNDKRLSEILRDFRLHKAFEAAIKLKSSSEVRVEVIGEESRIFDVLVSPLNLSETYSAIGVFYEVTRVERLERVRQEFLSNISHELRTPLTSILAFVETLEEGAIDDEKNNRRFLEVIRKNANRMHLLIQDISELSSIEAGNVKMRPEELNARKMAGEIISSLSALAARYEVTLSNNIPENTSLKADAVRLQQMLTNLVENAIKFNRRGGTVKILSELQDDRYILRVVDTGEGISREHMQRIFERFYRIDKARSREIGGTGLGLAIVKHLARLHGGEVTVSSAPGEGTTFSIFLPKH